MLRNKSLQPLSRQHHDELLGCLMIKKGVLKNTDIGLLTDFTNTFWKENLKNHLDLEEKVLIPFLIRHGFEKRYINIIRTDHSIIHAVLDRLNAFDHRHKVLEIFATLVEQHIRFEERFIFGVMQELLTEKQLQELGLQLDSVPLRKCTDYPVKFWE